MNIQEKIFSALKPKVASLGFNKKELMGISAAIANNLNLDENAEEEAVTTAIDEQIGAVIPILQIGQSQGNRLLDAYKLANPKATEPEVDGDKDGKSGEPKPSGADSETAKMLAQMAESMKALQTELNSLKSNNLTTSRKSQLGALVKDSGAFGTSILKNFERMSFDKDEDFDTFMDEVKNDLESYAKEKGNATLGTMANHPPQGSGQGNETEITDKQIEDVVNLF